MSILDTDKILVNRSGSSYQVEAQNFDKVQDDDLLLVNRGEASYQCSRANIDSKLLDDDILLINRDGLSYQCTGLEFKEISGGGAGEFAFNTIQYTGTGETLKVDADVDLTEGGFVWIKSTGQSSHRMYDTVQGPEKFLQPNTTTPQVASPEDAGIVSFNKNGFTLGSVDAGVNTLDEEYTAWVFKKTPGFLDIVKTPGKGTYTHNLNAKPTFVIAKSLDVAGNWFVYEFSKNLNAYTVLNSSAKFVSSSGAWGTEITDTEFTLGTPFGNTPYIVYLFRSNQQTISNASYLGNNAYNLINCGFKPGFSIIKNYLTTGNWVMTDSVRGIDHYYTADENNPDQVNVSLIKAYTDTGIELGANNPLNTANGQYQYFAVAENALPPEYYNNGFSDWASMLSANVGTVLNTTNAFDGSTSTYASCDTADAYMEILFPEPLVGTATNPILLLVRVYAGNATLVVFDKDGTSFKTESFTGTSSVFLSGESIGFIRFIGQGGTNIKPRLYNIDMNYTDTLIQGKPVFI